VKCDKPDGGHKIAYANKSQALRAAKRIQRAGGGVRMVAYHCDRCGRWHVGSDDRLDRFDIAIAVEIGERALFHWRRESGGNRKLRAGRLVARVGRRAA
jgi:hypothetical protein